MSLVELYLDFQVCKGIFFLLIKFSTEEVEDFDGSSTSEEGKFKTSDESNESVTTVDAAVVLDW